MDHEKFKNYSQGVGSLITAAAVVVAGIFALYKFSSIESAISEANLAGAIGGTRAQVAIESSLNIGQIFVDNESYNNAVKNMDEIESCEWEGDCSGLLPVRRVSYLPPNASCGERERLGHSEVLSGWNFTIDLSIVNQSTLPLVFSVEKLVVEEASSFMTFGKDVDESDANSFLPANLSKVFETDRVDDFFFGHNRTEIGINYQNKMSGFGRFWIPFECGANEKILVFRFFGKTAQLSKLSAAGPALQETGRQIVHTCALNRNPLSDRWWAACDETVSQIHTQ